MLKYKGKYLLFVFLTTCLCLPSFISAEELTFLQQQARAYRNQGFELQKQGRLDAAMVYYQKAISIDPDYVVPYNDLGIIYEAKGRMDEAEEIYLVALKIDPTYLNIYSNLAMFYEQKRDYANAISFWRQRIRLSGSADAWTEKAKKRLDILSEFDPSLKEELLQQEAVELSLEIGEERSLKRDKEREQIAVLMEDGRRLYQQGDYEKALNSMNLVLTLHPENEDDVVRLIHDIILKLEEQELRAKEVEKNARLEEINLLYQRGEFEKALSSLEIALSQHPDDKDLLELKATIKKKINSLMEIYF